MFLMVSMKVFSRFATEAQTNAHKNSKMKDGKMLFLIHQRVNGEIFEKITCCENVKEAWSTLEKVRLQALRRKYELPMTNKELTSQLDRLINLAN